MASGTMYVHVNVDTAADNDADEERLEFDKEERYPDDGEEREKWERSMDVFRVVQGAIWKHTSALMGSERRPLT